MLAFTRDDHYLPACLLGFCVTLWFVAVVVRYSSSTMHIERSLDNMSKQVRKKEKL